MDKPPFDLTKLPQLVPGRWQPHQQAALRRKLMQWHRGPAQRSLTARWWAAGGALTVAGALVVWICLGDRRDVQKTAAPGHDVALPEPLPFVHDDGINLRFNDGSLVVRQGRASTIAVAEASPDAVHLQLVEGAASFDVTPSLSRKFRVSAGAVDVHVLGTAFSVRKTPGGAFVEVTRGHVQVLWGAGPPADLWAGQSASFPPASALAHAAEKASKPEPKHQVQRLGDWRSFAKAGQHARAYRSLVQAGVDAVKDEPVDLFMAADVARNSGHSHEAEAPLRKLISRYPTDPLAPAAAFTLGRLLAGELHRPADAADAFARARALAGPGSMAEDALVQEIQARLKMGDKPKAQALAETFFTSYPQSLRKSYVQRLLEKP